MSACGHIAPTYGVMPGIPARFTMKHMTCVVTREALAKLGYRSPNEQDVIGLLRDYTARREFPIAAVAQADGVP